MLKSVRVPLCILLLVLTWTTSYAQDRAFVFPTGGSTLVTVLDAADLTEQGTIAATATGSTLLATPRGDRYYVVSPTATDTIVVVDARTLNVLQRISLSVGASDAVISPDGERLLVTAGTLHVFSTTTDQPVTAPVAVGSGPRRIVVNQTSDRAYILAASGREIQVVDLTTFTVTKVIETPTLSSIALLESANRLVALEHDGIRIYDVASNEELDTIESLYPIVNGEIHPVPGATKVIVLNKGSAPNNTSQIFDVVSREVRTIGIPASFGLRDFIVIDSERAIAILFDDADLAEIDLTTTPSATVTPLNIDINARNMASSPNGRFIYISSLSESRLIRYDTQLGEITHDITTPIPPRSTGTAYAPSTKVPASLTTLSGKEQYLPPGTSTRFAMAVQVKDEDGAPLFDVPVVFNSPISDEVVFDRAQPVRTNANGVAAVNATILAGPKLSTSPEEATASVDAATPNLPLLPIQPIDGKGFVEPFETIPITATTSGGLSQVFTLNIIRVTGINIVSGNFQITGPRAPFPEPFVVLATDESGNPLPPGTSIIFTPTGAECPDIITEVDNNGFATVSCVATEIPLGVSAFFPGEMTASALSNIGLGSVTFDYTISISAGSLKVEVVSGNGQTGRTGEPLAAPLVFKLDAIPVGFGQSLIGVTLEQVGGAGAVITPRFIPTRVNTPNPVSVILGPAAGPVTIRARALSPKSPTVDFMIDAIGGIATSFETEGDQQSGRIGRTLDSPLRMRIRNELGDIIAFPVVTWEVVSGDASLLTGSDPDGATAVVSLGNTPGQIAIRATIGSLVATFNVTATPPQVATINPVEGLGQVLQVGTTSEPLIAEVREPDTRPAFGAFIDFSGPPNVELLSLAPTPTVGNPLRLQADESGRAGVRVRLLDIPLGSKGATNSIAITASVGGGPLTSFPIFVLGRDPAFMSGGVVNAATFIPGAVPGGLATIFGTGLFEGINGTVQAGGATTFGGTTVRFGGVEAPLLAFSNAGGSEQINLQVPFGVPTGQPVNIELSNNGSTLVVGGVPVFSTQPGIFEVPLGGGVMGGAVTDAATFQLITPQNSADQGQAISLFYTGGGQLLPGVGTGVVGPVPPSETVLTAEVSVDGVPAQVTFSGYAPGFFGLYQINFIAPGGTNCGTRSLVVSIGGASSPVSTINLTCP